METSKKEGGQELIKHSAAIHIHNRITLLQRRTWNALLYNAYNELGSKEEHLISLNYLSTLVGYDSHDMEYLKEASKAMMGCIVEWDVLDKDGNPEWGATTLLAQMKISHGMCTYAYSPELRRRLHNPTMYARLDLKLQRQFDSKYALALWELCADYLGAGRDYGETPFIDIAVYRKLIGVKEGGYPKFKEFNRCAVKEPLGEINNVSDFTVTVEYQRRGRQVAALKFSMQRKAVLPKPQERQGDLFTDLKDMPLAVKLLNDAGLSMQDAFEVWQQGWKFVEETVRPAPTGAEDEGAFTQYVREKIHLLKRRKASGKVENSTGFLREALKKNYANPEFTQESERQQQVVTFKDAKQRKADKQRLVWQLEELQKARTQALYAVFSEIAATVPEVVEAAVPGILADHPFLRHFYRPGQSALANYRESLGLANLINPHLEPHALERVQAVKDHYAPQITALEAQIAALA